MSNLPPPMIDPPIAYATPPAASADDSHLRLLAIFHYVWGGLTALFSSIGLIHVTLGLTMIVNPAAFPPAQGQPPPPMAIGWMFLVLGGCIVSLGWAVGGLTIYSGRCISRRRRHTFSLVMAGINCLQVPFGTAVGVFALVVLLRDGVKAQYAYHRADLR